MRAHHRRGLLPLLLIMFIVILAGCMFQGEDESAKKIDPPPEMTVHEEQSETEESDQVSQEQSDQTSAQELYLLDSNGYVVPQTLGLPQTNEVASQSLNYLVKGGPVTQLLPNGFQAVLPEGTEVLGVDIKDGVAIADFSNEFANYQPEDEKKIVEAITWTLTQFDGIDKVKIWINGYDQDVMPVNQTPIMEGLTRKAGINQQSTDVVDIRTTEPVTLYYIAQHDKDAYYVPVTKRISQDRLGSSAEAAEAVVEELVKGASFDSSLLSAFNVNTELLERPEILENTARISFSPSVLNGDEQPTLSENILQPLVLSLTELEGVDQVSVTVENEDVLVNQNGETVKEVMARPSVTNQGKF
ncbi:sporulation protein [Bacillaceae bacterium SIJ1]|uniref:GerMN domain-containing protein n=1 Tax=Litoribacterium kuwaitense TaxID=1398745 RepID=UPI0013EB474E|nr:GerMN domain-containing protein [Litoribacterium kuwaitense]NGP44986.1 sporulation protein [Litoribacterium kuwaitense]